MLDRRIGAELNPSLSLLLYECAIPAQAMVICILDLTGVPSQLSES